MKNILAENMRRFRTKNLPEQTQRRGTVTVGDLEQKFIPGDQPKPEEVRGNTAAPELAAPDPNKAVPGTDGYYYKKGEYFQTRGAFTGIDFFPFSNPDGKGANKHYDVMGKPTARVEQNSVDNFDNLTAPRIPTTWFSLYNAPDNYSRVKIVGYHPTLGIITEPGTTKVLMSPGKNLSDDAVYKWLWKRSGISGNPKLVGMWGREQSAF